MRALNHYAVFFLLIAFITTCCMMLFVTTLTESLGITLTEGNLSAAAKVTFWKVVFLSVIFLAVDTGRRKLMVDRPIRRIVRAGQRIAQGDFFVRLAPERGQYGQENFNDIIHCFNTMAGELAGVETLRTDFIANVSHELKTPLAVMQNYGTLLQDPELPEEERIRYAHTVTEESRRLAGLVTNILRLNRLENQQIFPATQEYDLSDRLCRCVLQFEEVWERKGIALEADIPDGITLRADGELLDIVWTNLLSNAFKFTPAGGTVRVTLAPEPDGVTVTVADTGCGMTPEVGSHIFEKFYQGDTSHASRGNGLGLALVKRIMDITGGIITVESEEGRGSRFLIRLERTSDG